MAPLEYPSNETIGRPPSSLCPRDGGLKVMFPGGTWVEYYPGSSRSFSYQILLPEFWAFFWVSLVSVWISVWGPQYWKLIKPIFVLIVKIYKLLQIRVGTTNRSQVASEDEDAEEDAEEENGEKKNLNDLRDALYDGRTAEDTVIEILRLFKSIRHFNLAMAILSLLGLLFCAATFIAISIAAAMTSLITLGNNALSTSPLCGVWLPNDTVSIAQPMGQIMSQVEDIYRGCYEQDSQQDCNLFPYTDLFVNFTDNVDCPFLGDVCLGGEKSGISRDTGYLDSIYLGLNSPSRPLYRRMTTCAPLETTGYSTTTTDPTTNFTNIEFQYGPNAETGEPSTYNILRSFASELLFSPTGYDVKTVSSSLGEFTPIAELTSRNGDPREYTFLMFVNTYGVHYPNISNDPIFPATTQTLCPNSTQTCWSDTILPSSVLGCTELAEVCYPDSDHCFDAFAPNVLDNMLSAGWPGPGTQETYLAMLGLRYSDFGNLLSTRHGLLLNATQQIVGNRLSQALDPYQWKLEVKRLFDMGLLRAKMEMLAVVRGNRANQVGYNNVLPADHRGLCQKIKFQVNGYVNDNYW
ncbi:hypothetical protein G7Y89_g4643 [Cudoniella acicularis]|uniref:Uncharacterized protein n=1 Tax=Cudoniella acicularis TaxID=354080 RepID=A0A8H4RR25_9HELO|nr:hypothetical protein G7Y89_g4643 [Cudoniella acicularis]